MISRQGALTKIFGDPQTKILKRLQKKVELVNALEDKYKKFTKPELRKQTDVLKNDSAKKVQRLTTFCQMPLRLFAKLQAAYWECVTLTCS